jgi:fructokinase
MKIGLDWGGTKLEAIALDPVTNEELTRNRIDSPKDDYQDILTAVYNLILETAGKEKEITVGIGMPGSLHPKTGLVQVSNTKALEGQNVKKDLEEKLGFEVKIANDADCLALSEAIDGAGKDFNSVFAVILGTGVGAGYVINKQLVVGPNKLTGEWGQNPIPGPMDDYEVSIKRHCGRIGAIEVFLSGPGLENWYEFKTKQKKSSREVVDIFRNGDKEAKEIMEKYFERTARAFSTFINILDPDVIVCGGGMSEINEIYESIPKKIVPYLASDIFLTPIVQAKHGASSGVRGAAHLW